MHPKRLTRAQDIFRVEQALDAFYRQRPPVYHVEEVGEHELEEYARFVARYAPAGARLLEFGAGSWRLPVTLHRHGFEVVGCDVFSVEDLERFSRHLPGSEVELRSYDGYELPFGSMTFDAVSSRNVLEHIIHIEKSLSELDRVLMPGGFFLLYGPNWSGPNNGLRACQKLLFGRRTRHWQYETLPAAFLGVLRAFKWYLEVRMASTPRFITIFPRMVDDRIAFECSDDDAVHLCQPLSFRKWFTQRGYSVVLYNQEAGRSAVSRLHNRFFPSLATFNMMVFQKPAS